MGTLQLILGLITIQYYIGHVQSDCTNSLSTGYTFLVTPSSYAGSTATAKVWCSSGYASSGTADSAVGASITCPANRNWEAPESLQCAVACSNSLPGTGDWPKFTLGTVAGTDAVTGTAQVSCATGYGPANGGAEPATITCGTDGQWGTPSLTCVKECSSGAPDGYVFGNTPSSVEPGATITSGITCDSTNNYIKVPSSGGDIQATCPSATGETWTFSPACIPSCSATPPQGYAFQVGSGLNTIADADRQPTDTIQFSCADGFGTAAAGLPGMATCPSELANGATTNEWSIATPTCDAVCSSTVFSSGNEYSAGQNSPQPPHLLPLGTEYQYACADGYMTVDGQADLPGTVKCPATNTAQSSAFPAPTGCVAMCPATAPTPGYALQTGVDAPTTAQRRPGSTAAAYQFSCDTGYESTGTDGLPGTTTCPNAGTNWNTPSPPCLKKCAAGSNKPTGYTWTGSNTVTSPNTAIAGVTNLACAAGFYNSGGSVAVTCGSDGTFSGANCVAGCTSSTTKPTGYSYTATFTTTLEDTEFMALSSVQGVTETVTISCDTANGWYADGNDKKVTCGVANNVATYTGSGCLLGCKASLTKPTGYSYTATFTSPMANAEFMALSSVQGVKETVTISCDSANGWYADGGDKKVTCGVANNVATYTGSGCLQGCASSLTKPTGYLYTASFTTPLANTEFMALSSVQGVKETVTITCDETNNWYADGSDKKVTCGVANGVASYTGTGCVQYCPKTASAGYALNGAAPTTTQATPGTGTYQFLCADDYAPSDGTSKAPAQATCDTGSVSWTQPAPTCVKKCTLPTQAPQMYAWGNNAPTTPATYRGSTTAYQFSCATGYTATSGKPGTANCGTDGQWAVTSPKCIKNCDTSAPLGYKLPSTVTSLTDAQAAPGSTYSLFTCATGYYTPTGGNPGTASCPSTGGPTWSVATPQCKSPCASQVSTTLGYQLSGASGSALYAGSSTAVSTTCTSTYSTAMVNGAAPTPGTVTCVGATEGWTEPTPKCLPKCSATAPTRSSVSSQGTAYTWSDTSNPSGNTLIPNNGDTVNVKCATSYTASSGGPTGTVTCSADGTGWSVPNGITCTPDCMAVVPSPAYEFVTTPTGTMLASGSGIASVKCATNYQATATTGNTVCGTNGVYQPPTDISCSLKCTTTLPNGYKFIITPTDFTPGTATANVYCDSGYTKISSGTVDAAVGVTITCPVSKDWPAPAVAELTCSLITTATSTTTTTTAAEPTTAGAGASISSLALPAVAAIAVALLRRAL